jgi:hypothetical protein
MKITKQRLKLLVESLILNEGQVEDLLAANPQLGPAVDSGIRNTNHLKWLLRMEKFEPIADMVGLIPAFEQNKQRLTIKDLDLYRNSNDLRAALEAAGESKGEQRRHLRDNETDIVYNDEQWIVVMPHTMESSVQWGKDTTWCTAATKSANLFYNYVGKKDEDIVLYYIIRKGVNSKIDPNGKLSVGFINGTPLFGKEGERGGLTVNAPNNGLTESSLKEILKSKFDLIMKEIKSHVKKIRGQHPAKAAIQKIVMSKDSKKFDKYTKGMNENQRNDFINIIFEYDNLSIELLTTLSNDARGRLNAAQHPNTPIELLNLFASDPNSLVRQGVAYNFNTPAKTLALLARDEDVDVRREVATNQNTTPEILDLLSEDEDEQVKASVAYNLNTTAKSLALLASDEDVWVKKGVAQNPNTALEILTLLSEDEDEEVRANVVNNPTYQNYLESQVNENWLRLAGLTKRKLT